MNVFIFVDICLDDFEEMFLSLTVPINSVLGDFGAFSVEMLVLLVSD